MGLLLLLLACASCGAASAAAEEAGAVDVCGLDCSSVYLDPSFRQCLTAIPRSPEARLNASQTVFPEDAAYNTARMAFASRVLRSPAAVFYAHSTADVAAAVKCAHAWGVQISPAGGRQGFQGGAIQDGSLVVDVSNLTQTALSADRQTMAVGAGNSNIMVQAALHDAGIVDGAIPSGACSFVGVSGWALGGGFGLLGRYLGLGCDSVVEMEVVLADGNVVTASSTSHPDLLWASCGSGGGTFGIVTRFVFAITPLPNEGRLASIAINYNPGFNTTVRALHNFQEWQPTMDRRFGWGYSINPVPGGRYQLTGIFLGPVEEAVRALEQAGVLEGLDVNDPSTPQNSEASRQYPYGLRITSQPSYYAVAADALLGWTTPAYGMYTPWGNTWTATPENLAFRDDLMRGRNGRQVVGGQGFNWYMATQSRLIGRLPEAGLEAVARLAAEFGAECEASKGTALRLACGAQVGGHVLGGAYADRPANASAWPHRDKYSVMDLTATLPTWLSATTASSTQLAEALTPDQQAQLPELANRFLRALKPFLDSPEAGYVNYQLPAFQDWQAGFFGGNYPRLQQIKAMYDPLGLFDKPFTVKGAGAAAR